MLALAFAAILAALWWWYQPTLGKVALAAANRTFPGFAVEAASVRRRASDHLEIESLRVRLRADSSEIIKLARVDVFASWRELRVRRLREVRLDAPNMQITDALLARFSAAGTPAAPSVLWTIARLQIKNGRLGLKIAGAPQATAALDAQLSGLSTGRIPGSAEQAVQIRDLRVRSQDPAGAEIAHVPLIEAVFTWPELLEKKRLATVRIHGTECRYDSAVRRLFPSPSPGSVTPGVASSTPWRIGSLELSSGRVRLEELGPGVPAFSFGMEASLRELALGNDPQPDAEQMQSVTIRGLEMSAPWGETEPLVRIPILHARFRWRELLTDKWIHAVEIDRPRVRWDATVRDAFQRPSPPATHEPAPATPFRIGILQISRAMFDLRDLGLGVPSCVFGADAGMTEVPLGLGAGELPDTTQAISIRDLALTLPETTGGPFLRVPSIYGSFTWRGLLVQKRFGMVRIEEPDFRYEPAVGRALAAGSGETPKNAALSAAPERAWHVDELGLFGGRIHLADLGLGIPPIDFRLNTAFKDMALSLEGEAMRNSLQTIELHDIGLQSPVDPFTSVLNLKTLFIRFTPAGLWKRQIEQVEVINPVLNIGEDLFWYVDRVQTRDRGGEPAEPNTAGGPHP